jgi:hypothetical protein
LIRRYHLDYHKIWRKIVDFEYNLSPNILWAKLNVCSPFWKGIIWAANAKERGPLRCGTGGILEMKVLLWIDG